MLEPVSVGLKFAFLIVLYLFLLWVSRSALKDLRRGVGQAQYYGEPVQAPPDATGLHTASSRHAKLTRQGGIVVLEDLGSTNGTYLNEEILAGPQPLHAGDRVRIGDSEFTYVIS
jgi:hypothetical protein